MDSSPLREQQPAEPPVVVESEEDFFDNVRRAVQDRREGRRLEPFTRGSQQPAEGPQK